MSAAERETSRVDVRSADGTSIAVWVAGEGPPLVLVHGSLCDHTRFDPLVAELGDGVTTFAMDRRGFGASGDAPRYAIEREFEDVAAVVDAVADRTGEPVALGGHSYGADCAMGGAARTDNVHHLLLYEPSLGLRYPPGSIEAVEQALAAGDREAAIRLVVCRDHGDVRAGGGGDASEPAVAGAARLRPDGTPRVPSRGGLGLPTGAVLRAHRADPRSDGLRDPSGGEGGNGSCSGGHLKRRDSGPRRPWALRFSGGPCDGRCRH